jgi:hypothetical protein
MWWWLIDWLMIDDTDTHSGTHSSFSTTTTTTSQLDLWQQ